jgi:hypothetical protein
MRILHSRSKNERIEPNSLLPLLVAGRLWSQDWLPNLLDCLRHQKSSVCSRAHSRRARAVGLDHISGRLAQDQNLAPAPDQKMAPAIAEVFSG